MEAARPTLHADDGVHTDSSIELFTVTVVGTLAIGVAVLARLSWKHLRSRSVAADAPIMVE